MLSAPTLQYVNAYSHVLEYNCDAMHNKLETRKGIDEVWPSFKNRFFFLQQKGIMLDLNVQFLRKS